MSNAEMTKMMEMIRKMDQDSIVEMIAVVGSASTIKAVEKSMRRHGEFFRYSDPAKYNPKREYVLTQVEGCWIVITKENYRELLEDYNGLDVIVDRNHAFRVRDTNGGCNYIVEEITL